MMTAARKANEAQAKTVVMASLICISTLLYPTYTIDLMDNDGPSVPCQAGSIAVAERNAPPLKRVFHLGVPPRAIIRDSGAL